jgi:hypothetical protein
MRNSKGRYTGRPMPTGKYSPFPTYISIAQLSKVADSVSKRELSLRDIDELNLLLNQALTMFFRRLEAKGNGLRKYDKFYRAIKLLEEALPEERSRLFWAISDMGERHALKLGLPPELPPHTPDNDVHQFWYMRRSAERLRYFSREVRRISKSLKKHQPASPPRTLSHSVQLIGQDLPDIFEHTFRQKYGTSRSGPGVRFVQAVLEAVGIKSARGEFFSTEAVLQYRVRVLEVYNSARQSKAL